MPPSWSLWRYCVALLFQTKEPQLSNNGGNGEIQGRAWPLFHYVFTLPKIIGMDPWGSPSRKICIYFSWRPSTDKRFHIISAYPYSASYHYFFGQQKNGYSLQFILHKNSSWRSHHNDLTWGFLALLIQSPMIIVRLKNCVLIDHK